MFKYSTGDCGTRTVLTVIDVAAGRYRIGIGGYQEDYGSYRVNITCIGGETLDPTHYPTDSPTGTTSNPTRHPSSPPTTSTPTNSPSNVPSAAPTYAPYQMETIPGSYLCSDLTESKHVAYNVTFDKCVNEYCLDDIDNCVMINYIPNSKLSTDSRCYVFDKQCEIYNNGNSGNLMAIRGFQSICFDFPYDWTDTYKDSCYHYQDFELCTDGNINTTKISYQNLSVIQI